MAKASPPSDTMSIARLADHLGLSAGTVSRALNGYTDIAVKTRERVQEAAREFGYRPSSAARRLARGVVETVGFVLPKNHDGRLSDPFLAEVLDGIAAELAAHDWDLLVAAVPEGHDETGVMDRLIRDGKVGGFIITRTRRADTRVDFLRGTGIPFVVHGRTEHHDDYAWLDIDSEKAFIDAVEYLVGLGHRRIALLGGDLVMNFAWLRREGFITAMTAAGLDPSLIIDGVSNEVAAQSATAELLQRPDRPTAILCVTDAVAIGAIHAISRAGLKAGREVSVIGYDGLPMGEAVEPALTTMSQETYDAGREVGRMLLAQARRPKGAPPEISQTLWEAKLTLRASANPPVGAPTGPSKGGQ